MIRALLLAVAVTACSSYRGTARHVEPVKLAKEHGWILTPGLTMSRELSLLDRQVAHLVNIVGNLVNVSRITQGKFSIQPGTTDLAAVVAQVIEAARSELDLRRHNVVVDIAEATLLHADAERLDPTLANSDNRPRP